MRDPKKKPIKTIKKLSQKEILLQVKLNFNEFLSKLVNFSTSEIGYHRATQLIQNNNSPDCLRIYINALGTMTRKNQYQLEYEFRLIEFIANTYGREYYDPIDKTRNQFESVKRLIGILVTQFWQVQNLSVKNAVVKAFKAIFSKIMEEWKLEKKIKAVFDPIIGTGNPLFAQQTACFLVQSLLIWMENDQVAVIEKIQPTICDLFYKKCDEAYGDILGCMKIFFKYETEFMAKNTSKLIEVFMMDLQQVQNAQKKLSIIDILKHIAHLIMKDIQPFLKDKIHNSVINQIQKEVIQVLQDEIQTNQDRNIVSQLQMALHNWNQIYANDNIENFEENQDPKQKKQNYNLQNIYELRNQFKIKNQNNLNDSFKQLKHSNFIKKGQGLGGGKQQQIQNSSQDLFQIKEMIKNTIQNLQGENKQIQLQKQKMTQVQSYQYKQLEEEQLSKQIGENYQQRILNQQLSKQIAQLQQEKKQLEHDLMVKPQVKETEVQAEIDLVQQYNEDYDVQRDFEKMNINHVEILVGEKPIQNVKQAQNENIMKQNFFMDYLQHNKKLKPLKNYNQKSNQQLQEVKSLQSISSRQNLFLQEDNSINFNNQQYQYLQQVQQQIDQMAQEKQKKKLVLKNTVDIQYDYQNDVQPYITIEKKDVSIQMEFEQSIKTKTMSKQSSQQQMYEKEQTFIEIQQQLIENQQQQLKAYQQQIQDQQPNEPPQVVEQIQEDQNNMINSQVIEQIIQKKLQDFIDQFQAKLEPQISQQPKQQQQLISQQKQPNIKVREVKNNPCVDENQDNLQETENTQNKEKYPIFMQQINYNHSLQSSCDYQQKQFEQECQQQYQQLLYGNSHQQNQINNEDNNQEAQKNKQIKKEFSDQKDAETQITREKQIPVAENQENDDSQQSEKGEEVYCYNDQDYDLLEQIKKIQSQKDITQIEYKQINQIQKSQGFEKTYLIFLDYFLENDLFNKLTEEQQFGIQSSLKHMEDSYDTQQQKLKILQQIINI